MNYLKFTQYAYLIAGILFAIDAYKKFNENETGNAYISAGFAVVGIFMFFFRRNFGKKFTDRNKKS